ncbi:MAG: hypothetical protein ACRDBQ_20115 [Shewanella sp.]
MKLQAVSYDWAKEIIAAGLHCKLGDEGLRITAISECLRSVSYLCSLPVSGNNTWVPAASVRLAGMVRSRLAPLWPNVSESEPEISLGIMEILNSLYSLGDMVRFDGGKWLPAPAHAVSIGDNKAILLGGGPTRVLPHCIMLSAKSTGFVRIVEEKSCIGVVEIWEPTEWIGAPPEGLEKWSHRFISNAEKNYSDASNEISDSSVYLNGRWTDITALPSGTRGSLLCKMNLKGIGGGYFIGYIVKGRIIKVSSIESIDDVRRYRFYLDVQAVRPIRVNVFHANGLISFKLRRRLPKKESKALHLGWSIPTSKDDYPGTIHHVLPEEMLPIIRCAFEGLGIVVVEK